MAIKFEAQRWDDVAESHGKWWDGDLKRPVIQITLRNANDPGRIKPALEPKSFTSHYPNDVTAKDIIDCFDYSLSSNEFLGDAFPAFWVNFGPGVMAAFSGCELQNNEFTTWFHPSEDREAKDISIGYNAESPILKRVLAIYEAGLDRWDGAVQLSMTDLGGSLDVVSSFRPPEGLLMDLYDDPESVKRLNWEVHGAWFKYFDAINKLLQPSNPGYTAWAPIFSKESYYMLQCDFSYMIGPDMFDEFVRPELTESCRKLTHPFYHLDGPGELPHLDSLLEMEELAGVQWVPGDGAPPCGEWPEVYRKIRDAGKRMQVVGSMKDFDAIAEQLGSAEGLFISLQMDASRRATAEAFLAKYDVK